MGVTNQEFINRADPGHQPGPGEHDPNDVLNQRKARGGARAHQLRRHLRGYRVGLLPFRARDDGRARCIKNDDDI
jgi:hypothetical protein